MTGNFLSRFKTSVAESQARLLDPKALSETLDALVKEGAISASRAALLRETVREQFEGSRYILTQLGVHVAIGVIFAFDVVPLPLGTIARVSWVGGSRVVETVRGNRERASVHSLGVLLLAAVPWVGYAAYLLPLRKHGVELTYVLANQTWLGRTGMSYEQFLSETRPLIRRVGRWLVPLPVAEASPRATFVIRR